MADRVEAIEKFVIRGELHSTMLQYLLFGMHTMVYGGTMYLYLSQSKPHRKIIITAITAMYLCEAVPTLSAFYLAKLDFVATATRRDTLFAIFAPSPSWVIIFDNILFLSMFLISDTLLIWRCYHVWGMSRRVVAFPSFLILAESCLLVAAITVQSLFFSPHPPSVQILPVLYDRLQTVFMLASLVATLVTTFLIGYRIHKVAGLSGSRSKRRLSHITTMIVESAALYSLALVGLTILNTLISGQQGQLIDTYRSTVALSYMEVIAAVASGLVPTILVARIALKDSDAEHTVTLTMPHISEVSMDPTSPAPVATSTGAGDGGTNTSLPTNSSPVLADLDKPEPGPSRLEKGDSTVNIEGAEKE